MTAVSSQVPLDKDRNLTFGSFEILGILKEAMVDILTMRGILVGYLFVAFCKQRLSGDKLLRPLAAIEKG